jgi:aspartyl-tRNA(Asn)/glutamyl-tRNA(Gln) amidotransferase subunit A
VDIQGMRIGLPESFYFENADPEGAEAVRRMAAIAEGLGARVINVRLPDIGAMNTIGRIILLVEAAAILERDLARREELGDDVRALLDQGRLIPATDYVNAQRLRRSQQQEFAAIWADVDCLFTPTTPTSAPRLGSQTVMVGGTTKDLRPATTSFTRAFNVLGLPALSMPCGLDSQGLPMGLQIVGKPFAEATVLRVAAALEDAAGFSGEPSLHIG